MKKQTEVARLRAQLDEEQTRNKKEESMLRVARDMWANEAANLAANVSAWKEAHAQLAGKAST